VTARAFVEERIASIASIVSRLVDALADGDLAFSIALAAEAETQLAELLSGLGEPT
jgi:hypothetical protein